MSEYSPQEPMASEDKGYSKSDPTTLAEEFASLDRAWSYRRVVRGSLCPNES